MTHPLGTQPALRRTPLDTEERVRAEANFATLVAQGLAANGRFRVSADTPEMTELFQAVAHRVGEMLQRPVVSYANGRYIVITLARRSPRPHWPRHPLSTGVTADVVQVAECSRAGGRLRKNPANLAGHGIRPLAG